MASRKVCVGGGTDETSSEMGEWWERKDHPLLNDVILSNLFEFIRAKDLKECRLVSKKWCTLSLSSARSKFKLKINGTSEEMTRKFTDFVEVFRENKLGIPFAKYYFVPFCTTEGPALEFLQICGSTAKKVKLSLETVELPMCTSNVEDISELLKAMPNIECFDISHRIRSRSGNVVKLFPDDSSAKPTLNFLKKLIVNDEYEEENMNDYCPTLIEEILSIAPNISFFQVRDSRFDGHRSRIGQVLTVIEKFQRESVIENFRLKNAKPDHFESLMRLAKNGMKLKNLDFIIGPDGEYKESKFLPQLARLFKNSIEGIYVDEVCPSFSLFPYIPKLERLRFDISEDFDSKCVNLNKLFPALKELELYYWDYGKEVEFELKEFLASSDTCPNMKMLCLGHVVGIPQLDNILNIFPKLTKIELSVKGDGVEVLRRIMTQMTQLEDLTVTGTIEGIENIDSVFTGIGVQKVHELEHVVTELKDMTVQLRAETIQDYRTRYCPFPSIANLTNLKRLLLLTTGKGDEEENEPTRELLLTDVFLYFGLYSMKHINKLEISPSEFTKTSCEILRAEMDLEAWAFRDAEYDDIIPPSALK